MTSTPLLDAALETELAGVADYDRFLGPEALSSGLHRVAAAAGREVRLLGHSREGRPIECLTLGRGPRQALVYGHPHPNEPIGGHTALHLAQRLADGGALGLGDAFTWHIVPCVDPDGLALNSGWLEGPYTLANYARHFYRPAGDEQIEWTFPFHYKRASFEPDLPETRILMALIDELRPELMYSLHNSELGGAYYYLTRPEPELHATLQAIPQRLGLSLDTGEPEAPFITAFADAIYRWPDADAAYDHAESLGVDPMEAPAGSAAATYATRHDTLTLVCELPYWLDPSADDHTGSGGRLEAALADQADGIAEVVELMTAGLGVVPPEAVAGSALLRATDFFRRALAAVPTMAHARAVDAANHREATVAEWHAVHDLVHSFRLRYAGMLRRGLEAHPIAVADLPVLDRVHDLHERWVAEATAHYSRVEALPIRSLVATQYAAALAAARHLAR